MSGWSPPADLPSSSKRWASLGFQEELGAWVTAQVGVVRAMAQVKLRPWSTVWRVEAEAGIFYAKQNCPGQNFEAALVLELHNISPTGIVPVAAADTRRGFLLTADQGPVLEKRDEATNLRVWQELVVAASRLQRDVVPHVDALEARVGLTRLVPEHAEEYVAARVDAFAALAEGDPRRMQPDLAQRLRGHLPVVRAWSEQVTALGLPLTLNHNDLHEHNTFDTAEGLRFFDFGDAVVTSPLEVLRVPLSIVARDVGDDPEDPRLRAVADAALEVWSDLAPMRELRAALPAALQLGRLARAESWIRCLPSMNVAELADFGQHPASWLASLTEDAPVRY